MTVTDTQKSLIEQIQKLGATIQAARCISQYEDVKTDEKLLNYRKARGLKWDYLPNEQEREKEIGLVLHSKERQERDNLVNEGYKEMKELFQELTGEKVEIDACSLWFRLEDTKLVPKQEELQPEQEYIERVRKAESDYMKQTDPEMAKRFA